MKDLVLIDSNAPLSVIKMWCYDLPKLSYDVSIESLDANNECKALERAIKEINSETLIGVSNAKDDDGKLLFSNQTVREAEVSKRLKSSEGFIKLNDKLVEFYNIRDKAKAQAVYYDKMFSVTKNDWFIRNQREMAELKKDQQHDSVEGL